MRMGRTAQDGCIALPPLHNGRYEERNANADDVEDCAPRGWIYFDEDRANASLFLNVRKPSTSVNPNGRTLSGLAHLRGFSI